MTGIVDTHAHLQLPEFDADCRALLARARAAGLEAIVVPGLDVATTERAVALAESDPLVYPAAGCHPHDAAAADDAALARLAALARHPLVVAVGEIGLDFYRNRSPRPTQLAVFRRQLQTAAAVGLPVIVHCREAHQAMLPLLEGWSRSMDGSLPGGRPLGVLHYYSGDLAMAKRYVELGFLASVHTSVTHPRSERLRQVAAALPLAHLVVETDSPYGAPLSRRGQRNEPAAVVEAIATIAELRGCPFQEVAHQTAANAARLFALARPDDSAVAPVAGPAPAPDRADRGGP